MNLFTTQDFERLASALPAVALVDQWESRVAKVADKVFALLGSTDDEARITVKVSEETFEILTSLEGIDQAPYFAKRKWVSISASSPLKQEELEHYIRRSYALVAAGLTRKLRLELGIPTD